MDLKFSNMSNAKHCCRTKWQSSLEPTAEARPSKDHSTAGFLLLDTSAHMETVPRLGNSRRILHEVWTLTPETCLVAVPWTNHKRTRLRRIPVFMLLTSMKTVAVECDCSSLSQRGAKHPLLWFELLVHIPPILRSMRNS